MSDKIVEIAKEHWPWIVGGVVGVYIAYKYILSPPTKQRRSIINPVNNSAAIAAQLSAQKEHDNYLATMAMISAKTKTDIAKTQAQIAINGENSKVAAINAQANKIAASGQATSSVIAANSIVQTAAIKYGSAVQVASLDDAAAVNISAINAGPKYIDALGRYDTNMVNSIIPSHGNNKNKGSYCIAGYLPNGVCSKSNSEFIKTISNNEMISNVANANAHATQSTSGDAAANASATSGLARGAGMLAARIFI